MNIYVTRPIPQAGLDILRAAYPDFKMNTEDRVLERHE
ncbi:D-glycerate dehydrogenase, partial [candidate division KSB1 bacterium]